MASDPNEIGDTLAGFAGSLAFIWIIVTVLLQSKELAAQREELALTRREFERMSEAQNKQVDQMLVQTKILQKQMEATEKHATGQIAKIEIARLFNEIRNMFSTGISVVVKDEVVRTLHLLDYTPRKLRSGSQVRSLTDKELLETLQNTDNRIKYILLEESGTYPQELCVIWQRVCAAVNLLSKSDRVTQDKYADLRLENLADILGPDWKKI